MFWFKVLSIAITSGLVLVHGLPTSVLVDSKNVALNKGDASGEQSVVAGQQGHDQMDGQSALFSGSSSQPQNVKKRGAGLMPPLDPRDMEEYLPRAADRYLLNQQQQQSRDSPETGFWTDLDEGYYGGGGGGASDGPGRGGYYDGYFGYTPTYEESIADLINSREEPVAMPVVYGPRELSSGYYGIRGGGYRKKRSDKKAKSFRLKRENSRIDAAEALALLELIEAQEEARHRRPLSSTSRDEDFYKYLLSAGGENNPDEEVWMNARTEPSAHFYGQQLVDKYGGANPYESMYGGQAHGQAKRFMVARKKRSLGHKFNGRHGFPEMLRDLVQRERNQ